MTQHYASFLIRCWRLSEEEQRIKIEHIQSGESVQVETMADAATWIDAQRSPYTRDPSPEPGLQQASDDTVVNVQASDSAMNNHEKGKAQP